MTRKSEQSSQSIRETSIAKGTQSAKKKNPRKWKRIVASVKASDKGGRPGQWSWRKAQQAVQKYQRSGGRYVGRKKRSYSLDKKPYRD